MLDIPSIPNFFIVQFMCYFFNIIFINSCEVKIFISFVRQKVTEGHKV